MSTTRRTLLRGLAAAPFVSLPALAAVQMLNSVDPIFAAIEKHKAAQAAFDAAIVVDDGDGPDVETTSDAEREARYDMHEIGPQTVTGLVAYVTYWNKFIGPPREGGIGQLSIGWEALSTIADALEKLFPAGPTPSA